MTADNFSIALVNPPDPRNGDYLNDTGPPPLGLGYIASSVRAAGFPVDLFDFGAELDPSPALLERLGFFDYPVYGFTAYTKTFPAALHLLSRLRERNPRAVVVFGGPHASPCAEDLLREYADIDLVVRNEGERPMTDLAKNLTRGQPSLGEIPSLTFREGGLRAPTERRAGGLYSSGSSHRDIQRPTRNR